MATVKEDQHINSWINLPSVSMSIKALFTGYILVVGIGLLMAGGANHINSWYGRW